MAEPTKTPTPAPTVTAQAPAVVGPSVLAFYTTGDPGLSDFSKYPGGAAAVPAAAKLTNSQRYQKRAESLASGGQAFGVTTFAEATNVLKGLPATPKLAKVYFVGHANNRVFMFHGRLPTGQEAGEFIADAFLAPPPAGAAATEPNREFILQLVSHLDSRVEVQIGFLACYMGQGGLIPAVANELDSAGFKDYAVFGYTDYYQTKFNFSTPSGAITGWADVIVDNEKTNNIVQGGKAVTARPNIPKSQVSRVQSSDPLPHDPP